MGENYTPEDYNQGLDENSSVSGYDSSSLSDMGSGYSDADSMDSHRNLCTETTCAEDGSGMEGMGHESDEAETLSSTGLPSNDADETARDGSRSTLYTKTISNESETSLSEALSSRDPSQTGVVSSPTRTMEKFFNHSVSRGSTAHDAGAPTRSVGYGDMATNDGDTTPSSDHASNVAAALVLISSVASVLLLFVFLIFLWKKPLNRLWSRRNSVRSPGSGDMKEEIGEVDQNLANPGPKQCRDILIHTTDPNKDKEGTLGRPNTLCEPQYAEVDEKAQAIVDDNIPQSGNTSPSAYDKVDIEGHGYADNDLRGIQSYDGNNGDDGAAEREKRTNEGHEATKMTGPVYHTLDPDVHFHSSYMSVSTKKQDDGYDHLDKQQNQHQTNSKSDSGYDLTKRIGKDDAKLEPSNTIESEYSVLCSSSANTTAYDKLYH